jgi:hypothetical protein
MPGFVPGIHGFFCGWHRNQGAGDGYLAINPQRSPRIPKQRLTFADRDVISSRPARPGFWRSDWNQK